ncbi:MAG: 30S ribosomal protein S16 [candidate division NC10 bacterium]|nr:30S ribosomal protein S16 [candidate division NC10 bacterium]
MAVRLRLKRIGAKQRPMFRIVVADGRTPRDGRVIDSIGVYNPLQQPIGLTLDEEKALSWLQKGARPTATVRELLSTAGVLKRFESLKRARTSA